MEYSFVGNARASTGTCCVLVFAGIERELSALSDTHPVGDSIEPFTSDNSASVSLLRSISSSCPRDDDISESTRSQTTVFNTLTRATNTVHGRQMTPIAAECAHTRPWLRCRRRARSEAARHSHGPVLTPDAVELTIPAAPGVGLWSHGSRAVPCRARCRRV